MAQGYKVRLGDGSEIGPMDLAALRDWYNQGLIQKDSPVLKPGSSRWTRVSEVLGGGDSKRQTPKSGPQLRTTSTRMAPQRRGAAPKAGKPWTLWIAGGVLVVMALGALGFFLHPEAWIPSLDRTPFREGAAVLAVLGLLLFTGSDLVRKVVRAALLVLFLALFPVAGALLASGDRGVSLLVVGSGVAILGGLLLLLSPEVEVLRVVASVLALAAGGYGLVRYGWVRETPEAARIRLVQTPDRRFIDASVEISLDVPPGWVILKKEQTLVPVPPETRVVVANPGRGGFGYLTVETSQADSLDQLLDQVLAARRRTIPDLKEVKRSDMPVGLVPGRQAQATWSSAGTPRQDATLVWRDGWLSLAFVAYVGEGPGSAEALQPLLKGLSCEGQLASRLQTALQAASKEVPYLAPKTVELIMGRSAARVLEPQEVFRRSYEWVSKGLPTLNPKEARELGDLNYQAFSALPSKDRAHLGAYIERVRARRPTTPAEDMAMLQLMKTGTLHLPPARLERIQALYDKAIRAAADMGGA
jgi:hypothetical protein